MNENGSSQSGTGESGTLSGAALNKKANAIFNAHKKHLYQRLVTGGLEHWKVSCLYLFSTSIICLSYIWGNIKLELFILILLCIIAYILEKKYATPFDNF